MQKHKLILLVLSILIIVLSFTACQKEPSIYVDKDDAPLMIYIMDDDEFIKYHINAYNALHDEIQIEYEAFNHLKHMYDKMDNELENDKGPDLMLVDNISFKWFSRRFNHFLDINEIIDRSITFNIEEYDQDVLDSEIYDDKRWYIPISYNVDFVISIRENLEKYYPDITEELDYDK